MKPQKGSELLRKGRASIKNQHYLITSAVYDKRPLLNQAEAAKGGQGRFPERKFVQLRLQKLCRHPRYLATMMQLVGAALVFRSWGGLVLAFALGLPLVWIQVRHEDRGLKRVLRKEYKEYADRVPLFWPRLGPQR